MTGTQAVHAATAESDSGHGRCDVSLDEVGTLNPSSVRSSADPRRDYPTQSMSGNPANATRGRRMKAQDERKENDDEKGIA